MHKDQKKYVRTEIYEKDEDVYILVKRNAQTVLTILFIIYFNDGKNLKLHDNDVSESN